jgi:hypothetical protein
MRESPFKVVSESVLEFTGFEPRNDGIDPWLLLDQERVGLL